MSMDSRNQPSAPARAILMGLCLLGLVQPCHGQPWLIDATFKIQPEYNDNPQLLPGVKDDTFGLTGGIDMEARQDTGATKMTLRGRAEGTLYANSDIPDDGLGLLALAYQHATERHKIGLDGSFLIDNSLENEIDDPGDIDQGITSFQVRRYKLDLAPVWTYALTERSGVELGYDFIGVEYGANKDEAELENYLYQSGAGKLFYQWTESTTVSGIPQVFNYDSSDSDTHYTGGSLSLSVEHLFSKTLSGELAVGGYWTDFDSGREKSSASGELFSLGLLQRGEQTRLRALVSRSLRPSGSGQMREADQVLLTVNRDLSSRMSLSFRARYNQTRNIGIGNANEFDFLLIEPGINWRLSERTDLAFTYRYLFKDEKDIGETADSNEALVSFIYHWQRR